MPSGYTQAWPTVPPGIRPSQLSGDIVPPAERTVEMVDLETGAIATGKYLPQGGNRPPEFAGRTVPGAGPTFDPTSPGEVVPDNTALDAHFR